ncbi:CST complex subunit CTC1 [Protopterus annectens]|uniref:CST complex subunit CTC1 n=1 Tax=Protopterus annectens TaxID=7888 RepID=UPI001CFA9571|nr:CST complex subunit CTC1 [Protopterus annectens]
MEVLHRKEEQLSSTEIQWVQALHQFTESYLFGIKEGYANDAKALSDSIVECIRKLISLSDRSHAKSEEGTTARLPVSYRFISVADLQTQQQTPCCSYLMWSTEQFKTWSQEGRNVLTSYETLCRTHLILIGYLTDQITDDQGISGDPQEPAGGNLYVKDNSGVMACEVLNPDVNWLDQLLLFPGWTYIPARSDEFGTSQSQKGYLEVTIPPVKVFHSLNLPSDLRPSPAVALFPQTASHLLSNRFRCTRKVDVAGELARVSPLLHIRRKTFFFFFLKPIASSVGPAVPVIVQVPSRLKWHPCFCLERHYLVTTVRVSRLKSCDQKVFVVTDSSELHVYKQDSVREQGLNELICTGGLQRLDICTDVADGSLDCSHSEWSSLETIEEDSKTETRVSKLLSYRGRITKVLNLEAGLYELDGKVGLCVSYQPMLNGGRGLRPGASLELHDVHLLLKPSEYFPSIMLGCCLQSSWKVTEFSNQSSAYQHFSTNSNLLIHLLFKYNLHLPHFLWVVYILESLTNRFCPSYLKKLNLLQCSNTGKPGVAERYLSPLLETLQLKKEKRDIYKEVLKDPHQCPLKEYYALKPPCRVLGLADICNGANEFSWKSFILSNFVSDSEIQHMTCQELNRKIAWSFQILPQEHFRLEQVALLGVLKANSKTGYLQLADQTATVDCIILQKSGDLHHKPFYDASFLDCLLQINEYQVIVERFQRSDYPSWEQLGNPEFVREKRSRVYIQFFIDDASVLNPSATFTKQNNAQKVPDSSELLQSHSSQHDTGRSKNTEDNATVIEDVGCPTPSKLPRLAGFSHQEGQRDADSSKHMAEEDKSPNRQESHLVPLSGTVCEPHQEGHCFVTQLFLVTHKEGIMLKNCRFAKEGCTNTEGPSRVQGGLRPCFQTTAISIGEPRLWKQNAKIGGIPELQELRRTWNTNPLSQKMPFLLHTSPLLRKKPDNIFKVPHDHKFLYKCPSADPSVVSAVFNKPSKLLPSTNLLPSDEDNRTMEKLDEFAKDVISFCRLLSLRSFFHDEVSTHSQDVFYYHKSTFQPPMNPNVMLFQKSVLKDIHFFFREHYVGPDNLTKIQSDCIKELVLNHELVIFSADKGGAVVVQDWSKYNTEALRQLSNVCHYTSLPFDPTPTFKKQIDESLAEEEVTKRLDNTLKSEVYRKYPQYNSFLHATSNHPPHICKNIPKSQYMRVKHIFSDDSSYQKFIDDFNHPVLTEATSQDMCYMPGTRLILYSVSTCLNINPELSIPTRMLVYQTLLLMLSAQAYMIILDLKYAYLHIPIASSSQLQLMFVDETVKWFSTIHLDSLYRLIVPKEMDLKIFEKHCASSVPMKALHVSDCPLCLAVQKHWRLQYVTHISAVASYQLLPFGHCAVIKPYSAVAGDNALNGSFVEGISSLQQCSLRLTVADLSDHTKTVNVYMDLGCLIYPLGLLPGAKTVFHCLERKYSRSNNVYCKHVPSSCLTVISFPSAESQGLKTSALSESALSSLPSVHLFDLRFYPNQFTHGQVFCHITSVLQLTLQWLCSLCHSIFRKMHCTRTCPPCPSSSGVFLANANFFVEDGTADALVLCKNVHVKSLLGLSQREWEGLQKDVALTGDVYIKHQGKQAGYKYEEDSEDILTHYLRKLCASSKVCRSVMLFFNADCNTRQKVGNSDLIQLRRFTRGDCEFVTKMAPSLLLTCLNIREPDYRALCHSESTRLIQ